MTIQLINDDCLQAMQDIPDGTINMVLADPPYQITACKWDSIIPLNEMWQQFKRVTKQNSAIVMTAGQPFTSQLIMSNPKMFKYCWVWQKTRITGFANAKKQPMRNVEDIVVFYDKQALYNPQGITRIDKQVRQKKIKTDSVYSGQSDGSLCKEFVQTHTGYPNQILQFKSVAKTIHPTQKPVPLFEYLIKTYTNEGDTVLDFTMGSGTTGVACKNTSRSFIGIELDPEYFTLAKNRINSQQ